MEIFDIDRLASSYQFLSAGSLRLVTVNTKENGIRANARIPAGFGCTNGAGRRLALLARLRRLVGNDQARNLGVGCGGNDVSGLELRLVGIRTAGDDLL
jgi:hypothetical protein